MKKSLFSLSFLCLLALNSFGQTIRRCNNNAGVTGLNVYTTIQAANDAATAGDINYVEPSTTNMNYGALTITKTLKIVGQGYNFQYNSLTNNPFNKTKNNI